MMNANINLKSFIEAIEPKRDYCIGYFESVQFHSFTLRNLNRKRNS